ncbi:CRISPR-associated RAMP protein [Candidatus Poribacteria bacterium]|nr:CRISPR-associated RAMP protein [Candidatus Poribacteria bacterium]
MHKRIVNEAIIELEISPAGPILVESGGQGADPTKPDMEFVETYHAGGKTVYLPGSSLKGALRSHCERIVRSVGSDRHVDSGVWSCDPLDDRSYCRRTLNGRNSQTIYRESCTICKLFGSTQMASHLRIYDAYPTKPQEIILEERNGVAIDRVFGSVAVGPFNYQVVTAGTFVTKIYLKNFITAQLGLLALTIRDFDEQRVGIGFARTRGMGQIYMKAKSIEIIYPAAIIENERIKTLGVTNSAKVEDVFGKQHRTYPPNEILGAGCFVVNHENYGYPSNDRISVSVTASADEFGFGVIQKFADERQIVNLWRACVGAFRNLVEGRVG